MTRLHRCRSFRQFFAFLLVATWQAGMSDDAEQKNPAPSEQSLTGGAGGFILDGALRLPRVQRELQLSPEQVLLCERLTTEARRRNQRFQDRLANPADPRAVQHGREIRIDLSAEILQKLPDILNVEQMKRLKQIELQARDLGAFNDPEVKRVLQLTERQQAQLDALVLEAADKIHKMSSSRKKSDADEAKEMDTLIADLMTRAVSILTEPQKGAWKELIGEPFEYPWKQLDAAGFPAGGKSCGTHLKTMSVSI